MYLNEHQIKKYFYHKNRFQKYQNDFKDDSYYDLIDYQS